MIIGASLIANCLTDNFWRALGITLGIALVATAIATNGMNPPVDKQ